MPSFFASAAPTVGLAGAPHAEQRDRLLRDGRLGRREQRRQHGAERVRNLGEPAERDVAVARFELGEEPLGHPASLGELAARPALPLALARATAAPTQSRQRSPCAI